MTNVVDSGPVSSAGQAFRLNDNNKEKNFFSGCTALTYISLTTEEIIMV
jgi:hypothetical protein